LTKQPTHAQFERILKELGFRTISLPGKTGSLLGKGVAYKHDPSGIVLAVPLHKPNESVPQHVVVSARHQLDVFGVMERVDFDALLQAAAA